MDCPLHVRIEEQITISAAGERVEVRDVPHVQSEEHTPRYVNGIAGATYLGSPGASTDQHKPVETAKQSPRMKDNQRAPHQSRPCLAPRTPPQDHEPKGCSLLFLEPLREWFCEGADLTSPEVCRKTIGHQAFVKILQAFGSK